MKAYGGGRYNSAILDPIIDGGEWSASCPDQFTPRKIVPGIHWIGGWVSPRAGLDVVEKRTILPLPGFETQPSLNE
jgi:hypothetical protein